jgi:putative transposase
MLAVARQESSAMPPAPRGVAWVIVAEAAERMGVTEREVRHLCGGTWYGHGLAKLGKPEGGGKARWVIREDADARLARYKRADEIQPDKDLLAMLTDAQKAELQADVELLKRADQARAAGVRAGIGNVRALQDFFARQEPAKGSYATFLQKWKAYRAGGIQALIDGRWMSKRDGDSDDGNDKRMLLRAGEFYRDASAPSQSECYRAAEWEAVQKGWHVWKRRTVAAFLAKLPVAEVTYRRYGRERFDNECEPYNQRSYASVKSNEIWQSDHCHLDIICRVGEKVDPRTGDLTPQYGRPWLTTWIDLRSRKVLAFRIRATDPDSGVILEVFRRAALAHGVPLSVYTDCGRDYDARDWTGASKAERRKRRQEKPESESPFSGIYAMLGVRHRHANPYGARSKLIERWHRTLKEQFCRQWETFTGGNTVEKPERLAEKVAKDQVPALEEIVAAFPEWVELYHNTVHTGDAMNCTPTEAYAENLEKKRTASAQLLDQLLLRRVGPVKVGRNGVRYHGLYFGQYDLGHLQGQEVFLAVDDQDMSKVTVWDGKGLFLALANANQVIPANADRELLRAAIKRQRAYSRALRNAQPARAAMHEDLPATMFALQRERAAALAAKRNPPTPPTPTIVPIRSPLEGQLKRVQEALENAKPENRAARAKALEDLLDREAEIFAEDDARKEQTQAAEEEGKRAAFKRELQAFGCDEDEVARPNFRYESPFQKRIRNVPSLVELMGGSELNESAGAK